MVLESRVVNAGARGGFPYLIMGVGVSIAARWVPVIERGGFSPIPFFYVMGGSLVFLFLWVGEVRLTDVSFDMRQTPLAQGFFTGDYEGLTASGNKFGALFSMSHPGDPTSIFFRRTGP